jgi:hypothetical protein
MIRDKKRNKFKHRKISETFLDFSSPLLDALGENASKYQVEQVLKIAFTVWNAAVLDTVKGNTQFVNQLMESTSEDPMSATLIMQMINRKQDVFSCDHRLIGEYWLTKKKGEWRLRAEAKDPLTID